MARPKKIVVTDTNNAIIEVPIEQAKAVPEKLPEQSYPIDALRQIADKINEVIEYLHG